MLSTQCCYCYFDGCRFTVSRLLPGMLLPWQHIDRCYSSRDLCRHCFFEVARYNK